MTPQGYRIDWRSWPPWAIVGAFAIEAGVNYVGGYELMGAANGGAKAQVIAIGCVLVAVLCAWAGKEAVPLWHDPMRRPAAYVLVGAALLGFVVSQMTGHRVLGVTFADGALQRQMASDSVESWREEVKRIGITRPVTSIQNDLNLELRRKSKQYPNGDGPEALKLKNELAAAERKRDLESKLAGAQAKGGAVKAGAENMINERLGISQEGSLLFLILAITALIGFFANFGFLLLAVVHGQFVGAGRQPVPFDPSMLPAPMRPGPVALPPPAWGGAAGATPGYGGPPQSGGPGGGSTNIIYAGAGGGNVEPLPPRLAARRRQ